MLRQADLECLLETKATRIVEFIGGLRGTLWLIFEKGASAAWLHHTRARNIILFLLPVSFFATPLAQ